MENAYAFVRAAFYRRLRLAMFSHDVRTVVTLAMDERNERGIRTPLDLLREIEATFADSTIDHLDGVTATYADWWVNVRPSNTEPYLRMCLEADTLEIMEQRRAQMIEMLGEPV